jgi:excisionase family DNA binding protein
MNRTPRPPLPFSPADPLMTVEDVAAHLRVSTRTVRRMVKSGALEVIRIGRAVRVTREALEAAKRAGQKRTWEDRRRQSKDILGLRDNILK